MLADFDLDLPGSLDEALGALAAAGANAGPAAAVPLAGGTNLLVDIRGRRENPRRLVALDRVDGLRWLRAEGGAIAMGARTTVSELLRSDAVAAALPSLHEAARLFAGQMVRNAATVAGNIACGSPAADLVPPLLALDAEVALASAAGRRRWRWPTSTRLQVRRPPARRADHRDRLPAAPGRVRPTFSTSSPGARATRSPWSAWRCRWPSRAGAAGRRASRSARWRRCRCGPARPRRCWRAWRSTPRRSTARRIRRPRECKPDRRRPRLGRLSARDGRGADAPAADAGLAGDRLKGEGDDVERTHDHAARQRQGRRDQRARPPDAARGAARPRPCRCQVRLREGRLRRLRGAASTAWPSTAA